VKLVGRLRSAAKVESTLTLTLKLTFAPENYDEMAK